MRGLIAIASLLAFGPAFAGEPAASTDAPAAVLAPWTAVYRVNRGAVRLGIMTTTLERLDDGAWEYRSESRTSGLVALFRSITIVERSVFAVEYGRVIPRLHTYEFEGSRKNRDFALAFDWDSRLVSGTRYGEPVTAGLPACAVDRHSTPIAVLLEVALGRSFPRGFVMVDRARIRHYETRVDGEETLLTDAGRFETIRMVQQRLDDETRRFVTWFAPAAGFVPVRIQSVDDEGADVKLELVKFERR